MTIPTFQAAGTPQEAITGAISPAWPAHQADDIGLLIVESEGHVSLSVPAGFKPIETARKKTQGPGTSSFTCLSVFWCRATSGAMSAPSVHHIGDHVRAIILTFRGCATVGNPWNKVKTTGNESSSTAVTFPAVTTTDADCLIVHILSHDIDTGQVSSPINANLSNITEHYDQGSGIGQNSGFAVLSGGKAVAGDTGSTTATFSHSTVLNTITLALTPTNSLVDRTPWLQGWGEHVTTGIAGDVNPPWPTGHQLNDIGILIVESGGWPVATPAGWTQFPNSPQNSGSSGSTSGTQLSLYWKRAAGGAEAAPAVTFVADHIHAQIITLRGCPPSGNPYEVTAGDSQLASTYTLPGATTTKDDQRIMQFGSHSANNSLERQASGETNVDLVDLQEMEFSRGGIGGGGGWVIIHSRKPTAGAFGPTTGSWLSSTSQGRITVTFLPEGGADLQIDPADIDLVTQNIGLEREFLLDVQQASVALTEQNIEFEVTFDYEIFVNPATIEVAEQDIQLEKRFGRWTREAPAEGSWNHQAPTEE